MTQKNRKSFMNDPKDDSMAPLRGQVMRVKAPWIKEVIMDDLDDGNYIISK